MKQDKCWSGEAGPPQRHHERTEDPRRARPKGGANGQKRTQKDQGKARPRKPTTGQGRGPGRKGGEDQKGPKGPREARPRGDHKDPRAAKVGVGEGAPYCLWTKKRNIISATNQVATRANKAVSPDILRNELELWAYMYIYNIFINLNMYIDMKPVFITCVLV